VAAAAATATAVIAVTIALWDNVQTRRHNRLSVLPYVVIQRTQQDSSGVVRGEISMSNEGVGPAILRSLEIRLPAASGGDTSFTTWGDAAALVRESGVQIRGWMDVDSGSALGVQRDGMLLRVVADGGDANRRIQALLDGLGLRLRYASVYGDPGESLLGSWPQEH